MKKCISVLLVVCLLFASLPLTYAEDTVLPDYDPEAAVAFAKEHWDDGYGQCAEFVNRCLTVGGIVVPNDFDYYQYWEPRYWGSRLGPYTNPYVCSGALLKYLSNYYPVITDPTFEDMHLGDVIFMSAGNPDGHTGIITGFDGEMPLYSAHNMACLDDPVTTQTVNFVVNLSQKRCDNEAGCAADIFDDMPRPTEWSHEAIDFVYLNGLFNGVSETSFAPEETMTRGMVAMVLWRMAGSDPWEYECSYTDVPEGSWYQSVIGWVSRYEIIVGYGDGIFDPEAPVTREQMATILFRYARKFRTDDKLRTWFDGFADGEAVSDWAVEGLQWSIAHNIILGAAENDAVWLYPDRNITRAEVAAMLMRFTLLFE